ncbi:zinc-binding alcohol dehydrogenase family protein [Flagellimonas algicola]|uniref:Zinc-binding alcohol dehydrogenase family protein n=1 Tax=Flagellimonas algicola TaxID=2583815 RepID=A0ABY2WRE7_9FLAO|nr:zinc-binding alcohol dehydrogenase family protein [Allomuricauda algicola]TMU57292.1 zinc-binding alcohol dehydrogenase family protein [Allomuricauda algicola]
MKYIVCESPGQFILKEKKEPTRSSTEAILEVKKVGICGTDLHAYAGNQPFFTYPRILGHELATQVVEIDKNEQGIKTGDNVIVMPYVNCGNCNACRNGKTNCCSNLQVLGVHTDGGMQQRIAVPVSLLIPARDLTNDQMAIVEPLAIGAHAIRRSNLKPGETVVVVGCGPIGLGIMKLAQIAGSKVIAIDMNQQRLDYAQNNIGVEYVVLGGNHAAQHVFDITDGDLANVVFDATGHKGALESGIEYMAHGGRYVLVGLSKGELVYSHPKIHSKETSILCSRNATIEDFENVISVLEEGKFPLDSFITHKATYTEMIANFDGWLDPANGVIKALVDFD